MDWFQSLIWVACPTGLYEDNGGRLWTGFNPSYGLHALRAPLPWVMTVTGIGFNPSYGLHALRAVASHRGCLVEKLFQSLIWVACPTGGKFCVNPLQFHQVSIPHMGCMPYGLWPSTAYLRGKRFQSLIWVACPTGPLTRLVHQPLTSFNPSYGLHALRATKNTKHFFATDHVSIPHMGCMPYGHPHNTRIPKH